MNHKTISVSCLPYNDTSESNEEKSMHTIREDNNDCSL